jgi:hypothetical protein
MRTVTLAVVSQEIINQRFRGAAPLVSRSFSLLQAGIDFP